MRNDKEALAHTLNCFCLIGVFIVLIVILAPVVYIFLTVVFMPQNPNIANASPNASGPYAEYGVTLPEEFSHEYSCMSQPGFQGDKCSFVSYKTGSETDFFSDFSDGPSDYAEREMNFVQKSAKVPSNYMPDLSDSYMWKTLTNYDDILVILYFPDKKEVCFGEIIV